MSELDRDVRRELENAVRRARRLAEDGARKALKQLAVHHHEPWATSTPEQRSLRNRLRAHARQLGDRRDEKRGTQAIDRLTTECAYEHWHRMLFARFLAETDLLIEPATGVAISLEECRELARAQGQDWLDLASGFAERMLPQIFRKGDPILEVALPLETRSELEDLLRALPRHVFLAHDSLGWVYQFWQADRKDEVNRAGTKIGANELSAVTQLFTEDYMVLFLLHNTLGAWWAGRVLAARPEIATTAKTEDELRAACVVGDIDWTYLRFVREANGPWRPAAGTFDGWPRAAKHVTVLDPCMGSGHFLVFALRIFTALRAAEEDLPPKAAIEAVLRENLFGLEIDPRCTQIAAFNLALAAWRLAGYQPLPPLQLACSGLSISAHEQDWLALAGQHARLRGGMARLYRLFEQAPTLGSLINPRALDGDLLVAEFRDLQPLLDQALAHESANETTYELAVMARGVAQAAEILTSQFTLVTTNVPYLGRGKQDDVLKDYCERIHPEAKTDLATCFVERCLGFCPSGGSIALVTPQNWLFLASHRKLREGMLNKNQFEMVVRLGAQAFQTPMWDFNVAFVTVSRRRSEKAHRFAGLDVAELATPAEKKEGLRGKQLAAVSQSVQLRNPGTKVMLDNTDPSALLGSHASSFQGIKTGDDERVRRGFWEIPQIMKRWRFFQSTVEQTKHYGGLESLLDWLDDGSGLARRQGLGAWGRRGVMVSQMGQLPVALFLDDAFDSNASPIIPRRGPDLAAVWALCSSANYSLEVRKVDQSLKPTNTSLVQVPFDLDHWQRVAAEKYPNGLPKPHSDDPTQWLFDGHPRGAEQPLQVAVARLLGYRWPRQTGSSFPDCPALGPDGLESHADPDGIVCLSPVHGEQPAAARIRALLNDAFGGGWSLEKERTLIADTGSKAETLDEWLRDAFFAQHCALFHQRPFVWHVWDGRRDGFHALVNYHRTAAANGEGRRTLDKLIYTYLGDWIDRQRADQKAGAEGADARLAAAQHLKAELERILAGEPPHDLFVRWKPLREQSIGWEPDINDGVRINIRPFVIAQPFGARTAGACILRTKPKTKWDKDRGKEPQRDREDFPWFWGWDGRTHDFAGGKTFDGNRWNDLHYTTVFKRAVRERRVATKAVITR